MSLHVYIYMYVYYPVRVSLCYYIILFASDINILRIKMYMIIINSHKFITKCTWMDIYLHHYVTNAWYFCAIHYHSTSYLQLQSINHFLVINTSYYAGV